MASTLTYIKKSNVLTFEGKSRCFKGKSTMSVILTNNSEGL